MDISVKSIGFAYQDFGSNEWIKDKGKSWDKMFPGKVMHRLEVKIRNRTGKNQEVTIQAFITKPSGGMTTREATFTADGMKITFWHKIVGVTSGVWMGKGFGTLKKDTYQIMVNVLQGGEIVAFKDFEFTIEKEA